MPSQWQSSGDDLQNDMKEIQTIGIVGAGTMGNGIAHVAARSGYHVILSDIDSKAIERALATISRNMDREASREKFQQKIIGRRLLEFRPQSGWKNSQLLISLLRLSLRIPTLN